jgi:lipoprotein-releasing system ATP-binding protein
MNNSSGPGLVLAENIVKTYISGAETLHILKGISFEIPRGIAAAVSGQSGSGKSTLLNILGGLDNADSGRVRVGDTEITALPDRALSEYRSRRVGFIFQFHYLLKDFTALENVMLPAFIGGMSKKTALEKPGPSWPMSGLTTGSAISLPSFPAGNASGWPRPGP